MGWIFASWNHGLFFPAFLAWKLGAATRSWKPAGHHFRTTRADPCELLRVPRFFHEGLMSKRKTRYDSLRNLFSDVFFNGCHQGYQVHPGKKSTDMPATPEIFETNLWRYSAGGITFEVFWHLTVISIMGALPPPPPRDSCRFAERELVATNL